MAKKSKKVRQFPNPTGKPVKTGPVQIGEEFGWFVHEPIIGALGLPMGRPLPRLLRYSAAYLEQAVAAGACRDMGSRESRAPQCIAQLRDLAERLGPAAPGGWPHYANMEITMQYLDRLATRDAQSAAAVG